MKEVAELQQLVSLEGSIVQSFPPTSATVESTKITAFLDRDDGVEAGAKPNRENTLLCSTSFV